MSAFVEANKCLRTMRTEINYKHHSRSYVMLPIQQSLSGKHVLVRCSVPLSAGLKLECVADLSHSPNRLRPLTITTKRRKNKLLNAIEESQENTEVESVSTDQTGLPDESGPVSQPSELGLEIKEALKRRKEEKEGDLWSGVAEEIREIEWPAFSKVLGTTGVVLGVIAGSSVVLLTVNAVLAELSDQVFAGKGVQDFFG